MPDWQKLLRKHLCDLQVDSEDEREEVLAELADHLQEAYASLRAQGHSEHSAFQHTILQVSDWNKLRRQIQAARKKENAMNSRIAQIWLPSLTTLALSMTTQIAFSFLKVELGPKALSYRQVYALSDYNLWLIVLPIVGALGAFISARAGGTRRVIVFSGIFPALAWSIIIFLILAFNLFREHGVAIVTAPFGLFGLLILFILAPALSLSLGVLAYFVLAKWRSKPAEPAL
jgi:hypothetical protein